MDQTKAAKIITIHEYASHDPEYMELLKEYRTQSKAFLRLLQSLPPEDAAVIEDYLGLVAQMQRKLMEFACK